MIEYKQYMSQYRKKISEDLKEVPRTQDSEENPKTYDPKGYHFTEDPKEDPITENPKEHNITDDSREEPITKYPKQDPIIADQREDSINKDGKRKWGLIQDIFKRNFLICYWYDTGKYFQKIQKL